MGNIYELKDRLSLIERLSKLSDASLRRWGGMTVPEMLLHCTIQLQLALGEISSTSRGPFILNTTFGRWLSLSSVPWPKGSATPEEMNVKKHAIASTQDVATLRNELIRYVNLFIAEPALHPHPFFGKLNREQWGRLVYKHLDHHLIQFGV